MASISPVRLDISLLSGNRARVRVRYCIAFSRFDRCSCLVYRERAWIYGDDTGVGDILAGGDDAIPNGSLLATNVTSGGSNQICRDLQRVFHRNDLDEDSWPNNPDDIRARVTLTPLWERSRSRDSNLVQMNF